MQQGRPSTTARIASFLRAAHQTLPNAERISQDPYAVRMLDSRFIRWLAGRRSLVRILERLRRGSVDVIASRDRFADEHARATLGQGGQLVLLGAGLDTMAWRIGDMDAAVTIEEADFPASQQYRIGVVQRSGIEPSRWPLNRIAIDFESESLVTRLQQAGLRSDLPSLVNWMGVSYYLEREVVAGVLRDIRQLTNAQSTLVFDFFETPKNFKRVPRVFRRFGEPLKFFISAAEFPAFVRSQGFEVVEMELVDDLMMRYANRRRNFASSVYVAAIRHCA